MKNFFVILSSLLFTLHLNAQVTEQFTGEAFKDGKLVYSEKHKAQYSKDGKVVSAKTEYLDPSGKLIATLESNFEKSITAPEHFFEDLRYQSKHGIRYGENGRLELYSQDEGKEEETKIIKPIADKEALTVGCQGLAYYLKDNFESLKDRRRVPIQFLIPGKLDSYNFELKYISESPEGIARFEIEIKNWFLKMFAPKLDLEWDIKQKRLITYKGLSNLFDEKKNQQSVDIIYKY